MERHEVDIKYTWDLSKFYKSDAEWYSDFKKLKTYKGKFEKFKGKLNNKKCLLEYFELSKEVELLLNKLYMYCSNNLNINLDNSTYNEMTNQVISLSSLLDAEDSFFEPELLSYSEEFFKDLIVDKQFKNHKHYLKDLLRDKKHVLSEAEEKLISGVKNFAGDSSDLFDGLTNVDFKFEDVVDSNGEKHPLTKTNASVYLESFDRVLRKSASENYNKKFKEFNNTIAINYINNVKADHFFSTARKFKNTFEASLYSENISKKLYNKLVEQTRKHLPLMDRYYNLRKKALGLDNIFGYDVSVSMNKDFDKKFTYDETIDIVVKALNPLGEEYVGMIKDAFNSRWIDVYPCEGKRSGGYQADMYGISPVILYNFEGTMQDVVGIAHELGHAMHTVKSQAAQPYELAEYTIFLAEIASTFNEVLTFKYLIENAKTKEEKLYYLDNYLTLFRAAIFAQVKYSEFEEFAHGLVAENKPISKDILNDEAEKLNVIYAAGLEHTEYDKYWWSIIPHFYSSFYVYKYATGLIAAVSLASKVLTKKPEELKNYFKFLSAGGSDYSVNILKNAGVNLETNEPYELAFKELENIIVQMEEIVK